MRLQVEITLFCLSLIWSKPICCEVHSDTSEGSNWTCNCAADEGNQSFIMQADCSSSCNCSSDGGDVKRWICICAGDGLPKVNAVNNEAQCFTSCSCSSGTPIEMQFSKKKKIPREVLMIVLLICVTITAIAFVSLGVHCIIRRCKCHIQPPLFSFDKESSYYSATDLISLRTPSVPEHKGYVLPSASYNLGCIPKALFQLPNKSRVIHGTISRYSYFELESATNSFSKSHLIGVGGSSHVYCGHLKDGRTVAIKRIKTKVGADAEVMFLTEINLLSRLHHCHVVPLLGYCLELQKKHAERLLVFQYLPNGNLRDCLDGASGKCLDWATRIAIALGAARGLEYLHEAAAPRILHSDVKSTNILLDGNWKPKITDLGMAKHLLNEGTSCGSSSPARMHGTFGYFAPEYAIIGRASLKSDVFSFGVVLLELISGRPPIYKSGNKEEESLVIWATPILQDSKRVISELPDPRLEGAFQEEEMQIMAYLAKECLLLDPDSRPTMSEVVQILSTIAPERSTRKDWSLNLFQKSSKGEGHTIRCNPIEIKEIENVTSATQATPCSLCGDVDPCLCSERGEKELYLASSDCSEKMLLDPEAIHSLLQDDETVDLTEPRFESFIDKF